MRTLRSALRPPPRDSAAFTYRLNALRVLLLCGLAVCLITLPLQSHWGFSAAERGSLVVIALKNVAFLWWLRRRPEAFLTVGLLEVLLSAAAALYRLHVVLHGGPGLYGLGGYAPWMIVTYLQAFVALPPGAALTFSAAQLAALIAVGVGYALDPGVPQVMKDALNNSLLQTYLVHATFIACLTVQQRLLGHYVRALTSAQREATLAHRDALTGLPNRRQLGAWLTEAQDPLSAVLFDLDHFKRVNDTHGHEVGDDVLRLVARALRATVPAGDRVGRWGGEEFLILVSGDARDARQVAQQVQRALRGEPHPQAGVVTLSCGVAQRVAHETPGTLLGRADQALYAAKRAGRDTVEVAA